MTLVFAALDGLWESDGAADGVKLLLGESDGVADGNKLIDGFELGEEDTDGAKLTLGMLDGY